MEEEEDEEERKKISVNSSNSLLDCQTTTNKNYKSHTVCGSRFHGPRPLLFFRLTAGYGWRGADVCSEEAVKGRK